MFFVGIHPALAEEIAEECLNKGLIPSLENVTEVKSQQKFINSRFDFSCIDENGRLTIVEVKNVSAADYEDLPNKRYRYVSDYEERPFDSKVGYFPPGRYNKNKPISPRALKHVQELQEIKKQNPDYRCVLLFVIQRPDVSSFQPANADPIYQAAIKKAIIDGVEIIPISTPWEFEDKTNKTASCYYNGVLPINEVEVAAEIMDKSFNGLNLDTEKKAKRLPPKKEEKFFNKMQMLKNGETTRPTESAKSSLSLLESETEEEEVEPVKKRKKSAKSSNKK